LEKKATDSKEKHRFSEGLMARFLYLLITLALYTVPFLAPGISTTLGIEIFFGGTIIVFLALMLFGIFDSIRTSRRVHKRSRRINH